MTYNTLATMKADNALYRRLTACAAEQQHPQPEMWVMEHLWPIVTSPGWAAQWEYAILADPDRGNIGADESVITDLDILTVVQALMAEPEPEQPIEIPAEPDQSLPEVEAGELPTPSEVPDEG